MAVQRWSHWTVWRNVTFLFLYFAGDINNELVRHFLIESSPKGVKLKGCPNEPYFGKQKYLGGVKDRVLYLS